MAFLAIFAMAVLFCLVRPFLPERIRQAPRIRAISIHASSLALVFLFQFFIPRFHGGLLIADYCLMGVVPIAALLAGRHASALPETFSYGAICATLFTSIECADEFSLGWAIDTGQTTVARLCLQWLIASLAAGTLCYLLALLASWKTIKKAMRARAGLCLNCAYDLRAHQPGQKCPECGTSIAAAPPPATANLLAAI